MTSGDATIASRWRENTGCRSHSGCGHQPIGSVDHRLCVADVVGRRLVRLQDRGDADIIRLQPGVIGAQHNEYLAPLGRKIGPDPASINAAKIGGIAANNASGMCCGTAQNSYNTLAGMRLILADGTRWIPALNRVWRRSKSAMGSCCSAWTNLENVPAATVNWLDVSAQVPLEEHHRL